MSLVRGTLGSSTTNATQLYNQIAAQLTADPNWTETSDSPVSNATWTGVGGPTRIWKCAHGTQFYVFMTIKDNTTTGYIDIRASVGYDSATHLATNRLASATSTGGADNVAITPTADGWLTASTSTPSDISGWIYRAKIGMPNAGGDYMFEVRDHLLIVATRVDLGAGLQNYYGVVGHYESLVTRLVDDYPVFLIDHSREMLQGSITPSTSAQLYGVTAQAIGQGGVTLHSQFTIMVNGLGQPQQNNATTLFTNANAINALNASTASKYHAGAIATQAVIHHDESNAIVEERSFRGYIPDMICVYGRSTQEPKLNESIVVDGVQYFFLGACAGYSAGSPVDNKVQYLAIKG